MDALLTFGACRKLTRGRAGIADLLAAPGVADIEFEVVPAREPARAARLA